MNRELFWQHVDAARSLDPVNPQKGLRAALSPLTVDDLSSFRRHFDELFDAAYAWNLWGAAYLIDGGCSDDGFTDFRRGLIALGRESFETALADPDSLVDIEEFIPNESYGYVVSQLLEEKTGGRNLARYSTPPTTPAGDPWDFDDAGQMRRRLPRLWTKFGE